MGIALGRRHAGVPEQLLDHPQIGSPVEQMGGEAVPQGVGMRRIEGSTIDDPPDVARCQPAPPAVEKHGLAGSSRRWARSAHLQPASQRLDCG